MKFESEIINPTKELKKKAYDNTPIQDKTDLSLAILLLTSDGKGTTIKLEVLNELLKRQQRI